MSQEDRGDQGDHPSKKPEEMPCRKAHNLDIEWYLFFFPNQFLSPLVPLLNLLAAMYQCIPSSTFFFCASFSLLCLLVFILSFICFFYLCLLLLFYFVHCSFSIPNNYFFFSLCCLQRLLLTWSFCMTPLLRRAPFSLLPFHLSPSGTPLSSPGPSLLPPLSCLQSAEFDPRITAWLNAPCTLWHNLSASVRSVSLVKQAGDKSKRGNNSTLPTWVLFGLMSLCSAGVR